jgi:cytochrome bd-type quinol oxidase subunit 1
MLNKKTLTRVGISAAVMVLIVALAPSLWAKPYDFGASAEYRNLFDPDSNLGWINPRIVIWVFAQLHLLFGAFVLAVPMFVVIIEVVGLVSKDAAEAKKYDDLAHEFCRLLTTAFSVTSILGAIFTFACIGLYPRFFGYLVDVFGPTMYLYACIFFGESFSLYIYYYGWGKIRGWKHAFVGLCLNGFGITLMLIANAWTTFMMAPAGLDKTGAVIDRGAAFFNPLLSPINIHRLIANLCLGGSVAGAYAAYKFLSTKDPAKRAHYDWMGYIGNFIAILALLPLPFAGYYLGFEIYSFNQQLGIYMMGGVLSWLFIVQAVLIGALFLGANYYLWLGMDRIEGSERYRGWIKFLLAIITICMLVWATPRSIISIITSGEIEAMGGTNHPVLGVFGVMSAKNTAVNLIILATFLSFILYRRGNKVATVEWASSGKMIQALSFGVAAAIVVVIGVGGYVPSMWLESSARIAMSPYQVVAVLICMAVVMTVDILMFRGAKEIGRIHWGRVSDRSQYCLIFLAVTFTWTMGLMGFARSSLRQHWHVYEVLKDTSPGAYTPALGYATGVITVVVLLFFALVAMVIWISSLGHAEHEEHAQETGQQTHPQTLWDRWRPRAVGVAAIGVVFCLVMGAGGMKAKPLDQDELITLRKQERAMLGRYDQVNKERGTYQIPVQDAMEAVLKNPGYLRGTDPTDQLIDRSGTEPALHASVVSAGRTAVLAYRKASTKPAAPGELVAVTLDAQGAPGKPGAVPVGSGAGMSASASGLTAKLDAKTGVLSVEKGGRELQLRSFPPEDLAPAPSASLAVLDGDSLLACIALRSQGLICQVRYIGAARLLDGSVSGPALAAAVTQHKARSARMTAEVLNLRAVSLAKAGSHADAARMFDLATSAQAGYEPALYNAARAYAMLGDVDTAVARLAQLRAVKSEAALSLLKSAGDDKAFARYRDSAGFRKVLDG